MNRDAWANLNWQEAQSQIGELLYSYEFLKFEEFILPTQGRADIIVIRQNQNEVITGVIEVKSYRKITQSVVKNALIQACNYINQLIPKIEENHHWKQKLKRYFVSAVFTKDYPALPQKILINGYKDLLPFNVLAENRIHLFTSVPENLIQQLIDRSLAQPKQSEINDYFTLEPQ